MIAGAEINDPWYGEEGRESMFAPWRYTEVVMFYPSVFVSTLRNPRHRIEFTRACQCLTVPVWGCRTCARCPLDRTGSPRR